MDPDIPYDLLDDLLDLEDGQVANSIIPDELMDDLIRPDTSQDKPLPFNTPLDVYIKHIELAMSTISRSGKGMNPDLRKHWIASIQHLYNGLKTDVKIAWCCHRGGREYLNRIRTIRRNRRGIDCEDLSDPYKLWATNMQLWILVFQNQRLYGSCGACTVQYGPPDPKEDQLAYWTTLRNNLRLRPQPE